MRTDAGNTNKAIAKKAKPKKAKKKVTKAVKAKLKQAKSKAKPKKKAKPKGPGQGKNNPNLSKLGEQYRWKPGQSGNPNGRPKNHFSFATQFRKAFNIPAKDFKPARERAEELGLDVNVLTVGDVFALSIMGDGMTGKDTIIRELLNRIDGKSPEIIFNTIVDETKKDLNAVTDEQLRRMLRKDIAVKNGNGKGTKKSKRNAARKKANSS